MGILDWIEEKARKKMRFSQVKILYQNLFAAEFLIEALANEAALEGAESISEIQERTRVLIAELSGEDMLEDASSEGLFDDNRTLKKMYAALNQAQKTAGGSADAIDFVERFKPAAGWKTFSDADWDAVVSGLNKA